METTAARPETVGKRRFSLSSAATAYPFCYSYLRAKIRSGELRAVKIGKKVVLREEDIEEFLARNEHRVKRSAAKKNQGAA